MDQQPSSPAPQNSHPQSDLHALHHLIAGAIHHVETEVPSLRASIHRLERASRERLIAIHGEDDAWRGLACDSTLLMHDSLLALLGRTTAGQTKVTAKRTLATGQDPNPIQNFDRG